MTKDPSFTWMECYDLEQVEKFEQEQQHQMELLKQITTPTNPEVKVHVPELITDLKITRGKRNMDDEIRNVTVDMSVTDLGIGCNKEGQIYVKTAGRPDFVPISENDFRDRYTEPEMDPWVGTYTLPDNYKVRVLENAQGTIQRCREGIQESLRDVMDIIRNRNEDNSHLPMENREEVRKKNRTKNKLIKKARRANRKGK